ncbi:MAG: glycosyltransferase family A protein [Thermoanaerobaculia bacterium]
MNPTPPNVGAGLAPAREGVNPSPTSLRPPSAKLVTVFTSTIYPDLARLWHACIRRSFPADEAAIEVFQDSDEHVVDPRWLPGTDVLRRAASRRDFHEAYNDALARVETPYLAFVDTDVFWIAPDLWSRVREELKRPDVGAVSCASRDQIVSHGTFAVVMKVAAYREALKSLPDGFFPAIEHPDPAVPEHRWVRHDTGDLATRAVVEAGWKVELLHLYRSGELARFRGITLSRRSAEWLGRRALVRMCHRSRYFWRGYLGNLVLKRLHDRLFADGPRYAFPHGAGPLLVQSLRRDWRYRLAYLRELRAGARRVESFVRSRPA